MLRPSIFGESLFDDWMDDFPFGKEFEKAVFPAKDPLYGKHAKNMMKTDVRETDDAYEVDIDLPGFKKDEKDKKTGKYIRKERYAGSMSRSFYIGEGITQDEISAKYENGILQLKIPKKTDKAVAGKNYIAIEG